MKTKRKRDPAFGMILEQRDMMYHNDVRRWLENHKNASASEIDEMHRRLAKKWRV